MVKKLTGLRLIGAATVVVAALGIGWWSTSGEKSAADVAPVPVGPSVKTGGTLLGTVRSEPRSFNRLVARDRTSNLVSLLLHEKLVRINLATQELEPALAESWSADDDLTWTLRLRKNVTFSDGTPFTSADVLFSLAAVYDEKTASPLSGGLEVAGKRLQLTAPDPTTVVVRFPERFGPGLRVLDNLPILPKHKLQQALDSGTLRDQWGPATPPSEMSGLGPFVLADYRAGERLTFARNPRYWRRDAEGVPLPYLDGVALLIVPDQGAELLRLGAGDVDVVSGEVTPEDLPAMQRGADQGRLSLHEVGVGIDPDFLWFNLQAGNGAPSWRLRRELRVAVSLAVDRQGFVDAVYLGAAAPVAGPITPGNRDWFDTQLVAPPQNLERARQLLAAIGLTDRNGDGQLEAPDGTLARFSLLTQKGNAIRERGALFVQQDLMRLGLGVDVVSLDGPTLIERITSGRYEAAYFGTQASDTDPATNLDFWLSSGAFHPWNPAQEQPATDWEARIDELMQLNVRSSDPLERKRSFAEVQRIFQEEMPAIYFAAPRITVATSRRLNGLRPGVLQPFVLWDAATLSVGQ